jgi:hypothetical protein
MTHFEASGLDAALFHRDELDRISRVLSALEGKTAMQLSELAKTETAYSATRDRRPISYRSAVAGFLPNRREMGILLP